MEPGPGSWGEGRLHEDWARDPGPDQEGSPPESRGTASAPGRGGGKTTPHQLEAEPVKKIEAAASPVREPVTGGTSLPPPTGPATQPTPSILAISTAGGAAPRAAAALGAATTSSVVRRPPRDPGNSTV